ncbi:ketopantoate reductase family protein [Agaricicola taiwanensis]|nr:2-dehydropantoate 2-reductase [Agaricicola taiwanensis]
MNICILGAGAIGGHLAARLDLAGASVSALVRGAALEAIREKGLTFQNRDLTHVARIAASDCLDDLPKPDVVIVAVKAQSLASTASTLERLAGNGTPIVFALNGLPWWYRQQLRQRFDVTEEVPAASDEAALSGLVPLENVIGCVVTSANSQTAPGVIHNELPSANRFVFGEATGRMTDRIQRLAELVTKGGATGQAVQTLAPDIWVKLRANVLAASFACLTGLDMQALMSFKDLHKPALDLQGEVNRLAAACGVQLSLDESTLDPTRYSKHKPSMLQDLEKGRTIEFDAVPGATQSVARWLDIPVPTLDIVAALLKARAMTLGVYP